MATVTPTKNVVRMVLNVTVDPVTGQVSKTANVSIGTLTTNMANYDDAKALAVATALSSCLTKTLYSVEKVTTATLSS